MDTFPTSAGEPSDECLSLDVVARIGNEHRAPVALIRDVEAAVVRALRRTALTPSQPEPACEWTNCPLRVGNVCCNEPPAAGVEAADVRIYWHAHQGWQVEWLTPAPNGGQSNYYRRTETQVCRNDGRCQYAIDHGAEGLGHCPAGKCAMPLATPPTLTDAQCDAIRAEERERCAKLCEADYRTPDGWGITNADKRCAALIRAAAAGAKS